MANILFPSALSHRHAFTPTWYEKTTPKPVFWLRAGSFAERSQYLADIESECGPEIYQFQKDAAFQAGLEALLPDRDDQPGNADDRSRLIEILSQVRAGETVSEEDRAHLNKSWDVVAQNWIDLRDLTRSEALRGQMLPGFALLHFCTGIDNLTDAQGNPVLFESDARGRMAESVLLRLDSGDLWLTGTFAHNLQWGRSAEKNLPARSKSGAKSKRSRTASPALG
jgi:hypothetical protein